MAVKRKLLEAGNLRGYHRYYKVKIRLCKQTTRFPICRQEAAKQESWAIGVSWGWFEEKKKAVGLARERRREEKSRRVCLLLNERAAAGNERREVRIGRAFALASRRRQRAGHLHCTFKIIPRNWRVPLLCARAHTGAASDLGRLPLHSSESQRSLCGTVQRLELVNSSSKRERESKDPQYPPPFSPSTANPSKSAGHADTKKQTLITHWPTSIMGWRDVVSYQRLRA